MTLLKAPTPTLFLDRDGVLNRRIIDDYVTRWADFEILLGVPEALKQLTDLGFRLVVVTNQRGIALGRMSRQDVDQIHRRFSRVLLDHGVALTEFYVCPHDRHDHCPCRKPKPGLLAQAHQAQPVNRGEAWLIGDSDTDIQAGQAFGVTTIKVAGPSLCGADHQCDDLPQAAALIAARLQSRQ